MSQLIAAWICAFLFGIGLGISGMTDPKNIIGFLDIFGTWKPALAFVMISGIAIHSAARFFIVKRKHPLYDTIFRIPTKKDIDPNLIVGSSIFGIGWGLGGFCPGPAITALPSLVPEVAIFCVCMGIGMFLNNYISRKMGR